MSQVDPLSIAMSGLANINRGLAVVSQNIANARTPNYVHETLQQQALGSGDLGPSRIGVDGAGVGLGLSASASSRRHLYVHCGRSRIGRVDRISERSHRPV